MEPIPRATIEATLPGELQIKLICPTSAEELNAAVDASREPTVNQGKIATWACMMRCTVELGGKPFDSSRMTPHKYRDLFTPSQMIKLQDLWFETFYMTSEEEDKKFQDSKRLGIAA